jgi:hypothetical protein
VKLIKRDLHFAQGRVWDGMGDKKSDLKIFCLRVIIGISLAINKRGERGSLESSLMRHSF